MRKEFATNGAFCVYQPSPMHTPSRLYVFLLTATLWCARYAALVSTALIDFGVGPAAGYAALEGALTSGVGVMLCLVMERILRRAPGVHGGRRIAALFLLSTAMAICWTIIARALIVPLIDALAASPRPEPEPTLAVTFMFFAWAGGWFSVAYAEQLREATARADQSAARIIELETLLGGADGEHDKQPITELWAPTRTGMARLPAADIAILTANREYVRLCTVDGSQHLVRSSLAALQARLDSAVFVQVHRSVMVNKQQIASVERRPGRGLMIVMRAGERVPVGRKYESDVRRLAVSE